MSDTEHINKKQKAFYISQFNVQPWDSPFPGWEYFQSLKKLNIKIRCLLDWSLNMVTCSIWVKTCMKQMAASFNISVSNDLSAAVIYHLTAATGSKRTVLILNLSLLIVSDKLLGGQRERFYGNWLLLFFSLCWAKAHVSLISTWSWKWIWLHISDIISVLSSMGQCSYGWDGKPFPCRGSLIIRLTVMSLLMCEQIKYLLKSFSCNSCYKSGKYANTQRYCSSGSVQMCK